MKNYKTNNGNLLINFNETELVLLRSGKLALNKGSFTTRKAVNKGIPANETDECLKLNIYEFICLNELHKSKKCKKTEIELLKYKEHFGDLPVWLQEDFKSEKQYLNKLKRNLLIRLMHQFDLKTQKEVKEKVVKVFTVVYQGRNGGHKYHNRYIEHDFWLKETVFTSHSRRKNLAVTDLSGFVLEIRGNVSKNELF